jgi:aspartate carbamoyltransferase catalytic subunit
MKAKIVYIDKWFFGFDKSGEIAYETGLMDKRRDVEFITTSSFKRIVDEDSTIYIIRIQKEKMGFGLVQDFL